MILIDGGVDVALTGEEIKGAVHLVLGHVLLDTAEHRISIYARLVRALLESGDLGHGRHGLCQPVLARALGGALELLQALRCALQLRSARLRLSRRDSTRPPLSNRQRADVLVRRRLQVTQEVKQAWGWETAVFGSGWG